MAAKKVTKPSAAAKASKAVRPTDGKLKAKPAAASKVKAAPAAKAKKAATPKAKAAPPAKAKKAITSKLKAKASKSKK